MKSFSVDNIFEQEMFDKIRECVYSHINNSNDFNYAGYYGRYWNFIEFPAEIKDYIVSKAREHTSIDNLDISYTQCIKYKKEGSHVPRLDSHVDNFYAVYTMDITVDATLDWPLIIEDKEFACKSNSAIFLKGDEDNHSRPEYIGNDDDYMVMLYVNLVPEDHQIMKDVERLKNLPPEVKQALLKTVIPNDVNRNPSSKNKRLPWGNYDG